jgi:protein-disulfide isomerase
MARRRFIAAAAMLWSSSLRADDVPWDRIPDAAILTASQRSVVTDVLSNAHCYGACTSTILECLRAGDATAFRLANFVARRASENRSINSILTSVKNRKLSAFPDKTCNVDLTALTPAGNADAPVRVVMFGDFDCPYCKVAAIALRELANEMPTQVSLWFKNYPLTQDIRATPAAVAYLAAERQGLGWEMYDALFAHEGELSDSALATCAVGVGVDVEQYRADVQLDELRTRIQAEKEEGVRCGFTKVPGILVDGKPYLGIKTKRELRDRIEEELEMVGRIK